mgnify:FL=1|jgi:hypothetical protein
MIPKIIHFCWLSGEPYPPLIANCLESWKRVLPDYEIMLWDTNRIDVSSNLWLKQSFENRKYAFAADYIRFYALYHYGGIYLDADVEVLKTFDPLLCEKEIIGEEASGDIEAAVIGVEKGCEWVKKCLDYYNVRPFVKQDGSYDMRPVPLLVHSVIKHENIDIKPYYFFSPKDYNVGKIAISEETYCVHHFDGKWLKKGTVYILKRYIHCMLYYSLGRKGHNKLVHFLRRLKK